MDTKEVANKWAKMCREGQNLECVNELYAENVTSREIPGWPQELTSGKQNVWDKNKAWLDSVEEYHGGEISEPIVAGNHFSTKMNFDVTFKERGRVQMEELAVFEVKDGKIVHEQFFYSME
ncbi:SnoaL-like domain-containing protein [Lacinutrix iliipiscaria]|uniref:SnoaL-like domain-containing protein n=1 Tax=Lacinutrix iliipiscaria TaxID=1230532 RepID=A0ABW5WRG4_9FLAO